MQDEWIQIEEEKGFRGVRFRFREVEGVGFEEQMWVLWVNKINEKYLTKIKIGKEGKQV